MKATRLNLPAALAKRVRECRDDLHSALAALDGKVSRQSKLAEKLATLNAGISDAEARLDVLDDDAVLRLTAKRNQRDAVSKSLAEFDSELATAERAVLAVFAPVQRAVGDAHAIQLESETTAAVVAVLPCFGTDDRARQQAEDAASQFPRLRQLRFFCGNAGVGVATVDAARRLLAALDVVLRGESAFVFLPE